MSNILGKIFKIITFGESHSSALGVVIDGCPSNQPISIAKIQTQLNRRKPTPFLHSSQRKEDDIIECFCGIEDEKTLGSPLGFLVYNKNFNKKDYEYLKNTYRPSHADFTTEIKYGIRSSSGGGRSSARETVSRVIAGSVAEQILQNNIKGFQVIAFVKSIHNISINCINFKKITRQYVDKFISRCPDVEVDKKIQQLFLATKQKKDSLGGVICCVIKNCPPGLGDPVFDKLSADLAKAMLSIPSCVGFEYGAGFSATKVFGSENNDEFIVKNNKIRTKTNNSGGIQGGISNGELIYFNVAFKPIPTIMKSQNTITTSKQKIELIPSGSYDICAVPRAVPIVESMASIVILDHYLQNKIYFQYK